MIEALDAAVPWVAGLICVGCVLHMMWDDTPELTAVVVGGFCFTGLVLWGLTAAADAHAQSTDPYLRGLREDGARTMMQTCHYELEILELKGQATTGGDWYACLAHYASEASLRHKRGEGYKMRAWGRTAVPGAEQ